MRLVEIDRLIVRAANRSDCAHGCRYCPIRRKRSPIALTRYADFVDRVRAWIGQQGRPFHLHHALGYHHDHDLEDLATLRRLDGAEPVRAITLGGLPTRTDAELESWLGLLKQNGLRSVHATFGGVGATHDHWNHKAGNYELLMRTLQVAGEMGIALGQRLLVGRSTLSGLAPLVEALEQLPKHEADWRYAMPFFYQAERQKPQPHVEADRIDEAERERLPPSVRAAWSDRTANLSEREWMDQIAAAPPPLDHATLVIRLDARTIDQLEARSISDIVDELAARTRSAYAALPGVDALMAAHGDRAGTRIYASSRCVEMKWLDAFRREHPEHAFDQSLTHYWFGG